LQRLRPNLIVCRITGYGQLNVWKSLPCHDLNIQAASGLSAMPSSPNIGSGATTLPVGDFLAAYHAAMQITAALLIAAKQERESLTLIDQDMLTPLGQVVQTWAPICEQNFLEHLPHYGLFMCRNKKRLAIGITTETDFWEGLCSYLPWDFRKHYRHWPLHRRIKNRRWLRLRLGFAIAQRTQEEWMSIALKQNLPLSPEANSFIGSGG
jgi:crotonobetainyl-CoA:carnitine CoA-transferase CaiB-like acyl-CoA transferase